MCISIPPKYAISNVIRFIKGKSAISIARQFTGKIKNYSGENFWARGDLTLYLTSASQHVIWCNTANAYCPYKLNIHLCNRFGRRFNEKIKQSDKGNDSARD